MNTIPKITPEHVAAQVVSVQYHRFPDTTVTVCCVSLRNGFNTVGHSACVSPELYDEAIGEQIAYKNALNEIWQLEGYLLAEFLSVQRAGIQVPEGGGIKPHGHAAYAAAPRADNVERVPGFSMSAQNAKKHGYHYDVQRDEYTRPVRTNDERVWEDTNGGSINRARPADVYLPSGAVSNGPKPVLPPTWGDGGDYAGAGASGSWEAPTPSACPAPTPSDPPAASTGDSCSAPTSSD